MTNGTLRPQPSAPRADELVHVRSRRWLVEEVVDPAVPGESPRVRLACADDDAPGQELEVFWDSEPDRQIVTAEDWANLASRGFDPPGHFAASFHTLRWHCTTSPDPHLFKAPFRAGIRIDAYQMEPLRKALRLPRVNCSSPTTPGWARPSRRPGGGETEAYLDLAALAMTCGGSATPAGTGGRAQA